MVLMRIRWKKNIPWSIRINKYESQGKAQHLKQNITALTIVMKKKETPIYAKVIVGITIGYALSPIDLILDFIPI